MPLALTCTCGARLEIDDKFAGQTITCPDCQKPLEAPKLESTRVRTSGLALASLILALVGAFTILVSMAAVAVGALALVGIARRPDKIAGRGFAITGIVMGILTTAATLLALSNFELLGLAGLVSDANWAGKLEFPANLEVVRSNEGYAITRPSAQWGVYKLPSPAFGGDLNGRLWDDLILVQPSEDAIILCYAQTVSRDTGIANCRERFIRDFQNMDKVGIPNKGGRGMPRGSPAVSNVKWPPKKGNVEMVEMQVDKRVPGEDKTFLVRIYKRDHDDRMYVAIAGVRGSRFVRLEEQFREALESFRLLDKNAWPDG